MPENFRDYVTPVGPKAAIDRLDHESGGAPPLPGHARLRGKIVGIRRNREHHEGRHRLDVSVGDAEGTEFLIRVPNGTYAQWEGKNVVLYLKE